MKLMGGKIKKFFIFAAVFGFLLALPLQLVQAQGVVGGILGALMSIPILFISILLQVLLLVSNLIVSLVSALLWWVLSPYFTSLPYTSGGIVAVGWPIVRDFVNMFFIVALVIIGLSTALRIKEYQAQKALPRLIIIAFLINFTPVICGLILDPINIVMNFFLKEITGFKLLVSLFSTQATMLLDGLLRVPDIRYAASLLGKTIGLIAFDWIAAIVFFMYAILFVMRYIMIWVLVIVSPLAFFSRIFPGSQKYFFKSILGWDEWWKQFIEWSMIGVIGAFFLYLGEQLLIKAPAMIAPMPANVWGGWLVTPLIEFINNLLPYGVVLAFLIIGFFTATETSAMGAGAVTSFFKEQGMAIGKAAMFPLQRLGVQGIAGAAGALGTVGGLTGKGAALLEKIPVIGKPLAWPVKGMAKGFEAGAVAPLRRYAARARRIDFDEMFRGMEAGEMAEQTGTLLSKGDRVSAAAWMAEKGLIDKPGVGEDFKKRMVGEAQDLAKNPAYQKSASDVLESLTRGVTAKVLLELDPEKTAELKKTVDEIKEDMKDKKIELEIETQIAAKKTGKKLEEVTQADRDVLTEEDKNQGIRDIAARQIWVGGLKGGDVKDIEKKSLREDIGTRRGVRKWSSAHMSALMNNFKKDVVDDALKEPGGLNAIFDGKTPEEGKAILEKLYEENPRIVHFFATTPAGRAWAWKGREFMPEGLDAFRRGREVSQMPAGPAKTAAEINIMTAELSGLRKKPARTPAEEQEITRLEKEIENQSIALGIAAKPGTEEHMVKQINLMAARIKTLRKQIARTTADEVEIKTLESTIADLWKRLGRMPPPPGAPKPPKAPKPPATPPAAGPAAT